MILWYDVGDDSRSKTKQARQRKLGDEVEECKAAGRVRFSFMNIGGEDGDGEEDGDGGKVVGGNILGF